MKARMLFGFCLVIVLLLAAETASAATIGCPEGQAIRGVDFATRSLVCVPVVSPAQLAAETAARQAADTALQNNINAEAAARASADTSLQNALDAAIATNAFATFRENGDLRGDRISVPPGTFVRVGSLTVPAGSYVVIAYIWFFNDDLSSGAIAQCLLSASHTAQALDTVPSAEALGFIAANRTLALTAAGTLDSAGTITLQCRNQNEVGNLSITTFDLNAIKVGTLTVQPWP